jgi:hypothetical protein
MGEKEFLLGLDELTEIVFRCKNNGCGTAMVFRSDSKAGAVGAKCPGCGEQYDQISGVLSEFRRFLSAARGMNNLDVAIVLRASALATPSR